MEVRAQIRITLLITVISMTNGIEGENSESHLIPCKEGWYLFGEKCYKVFGQDIPRSWTEAAEKCVMRGGHLATIYSQELQDFITSFMVLNEQLNMWNGLKYETEYDGPRWMDRKVVSKLEWHDGSIVNYTNWSRNQPITEMHDQVLCVALALTPKDNQPGKWFGDSCGYNHPYICQSNKSEEAESSDPRFCSPEKGGGLRYLNSCYHIETKEKSWDDAEQFCQRNLNGHLVSILRKRENIFMNYILSGADLDFWIGVKIRDLELQKWTSGWHVVFNMWDDDQAFIKGKCGQRTKYGNWITVDCAEKHAFVCEVSSNNPPVYEQGKERWRCPNSSKDWKDLGGDTCYIFETKEFLSWYEANSVCMMKGGALASIRSMVECEIIHHHVMDTREELLIGLHRKRDNDNVFQWMDGTDVSFDNWAPGEPSNKNEKCGELLTDSMKWNDVDCHRRKGYICSAKKLPPILYDENYEEPLFHENLKAQNCDFPGDITAKIVVTTVVGTFVSLFLIVIVIYSFKTRCAKGIQFHSLHNVVFKCQ